jgi:hypothetical protein
MCYRLVVGILFIGLTIIIQAQTDSVKVTKPDSVVNKDTVTINKPVEKKMPEGVILNFSAYDTIVKTNRKKVIAKVLDINIFDIEVVYPNTSKSQTINTSIVKEIRYANGRVRVVDNRPEVQEKDWVSKGEVDWKDILVTYDAAEITGMIEKGPISITYESNRMDVKSDYMEKMAIISLKRKAFKMAATAVLLTNKDVKREYGEYPKLTIKGVAYSNE